MVKQILGSLVVVTLASAQISPAYAEPREVKIYPGVESNFLLTEGMKMVPQHWHVTLSNSSTCDCRTACSAYPPCKAYDLVTNVDSTRECHLTEDKLTTLSFENDTSSIYGYKEVEMEGRVSQFMEDGNLYHIPKDHMTWATGKQLCSKFPGFRLAIFKTKEEYQALASLAVLASDHLGLDLKKDTGERIWGDGTPFNDTEATVAGVQLLADSVYSNARNYFVIHHNKFLYDIDDAFGTLHPICQAHVIV